MSDKPTVSRRVFLGRTAQNAAGLAVGMVGMGAGAAVAGRVQPIRVGVIGVRRQGRKLAMEFAGQPDVVVTTLCDVDAAPLARAAEELAAVGRKPRQDRDFRRLLDDPALDAIVIATPDHSHAVLAMVAVQAGKDVYLESPACHTLAEAPALLTAVRHSGRVVQVGLQDRSLPHVRDAIELVQSGRLGRVPLVKAWAVHKRPAATSTAQTTAPAGVDYDSWLYPTPERPFDPHRFHRDWSSYWDYGSGELGTTGVGLLDLAVWGLGVELPARVTATGMKLGSSPAETPDTLQVMYSYPAATLTWESRLWSNHTPEGRSAGVAFHGERGTLVLDRGGWKVYDTAQPAAGDGRGDLGAHVRNFLDRIRDRGQPIAPLETGLTAARLCHLGNIAYRLSSEVRCDAATGTVVNADAAPLVAGKYRPGVAVG